MEQLRRHRQSFTSDFWPQTGNHSPRVTVNCYIIIEGHKVVCFCILSLPPPPSFLSPSGWSCLSSPPWPESQPELAGTEIDWRGCCWLIWGTSGSCRPRSCPPPPHQQRSCCPSGSCPASPPPGPHTPRPSWGSSGRPTSAWGRRSPGWTAPAPPGWLSALPVSPVSPAGGRRTPALACSHWFYVLSPRSRIDTKNNSQS